ncbi:MAG: hypothetical protein OJF49_004260 [Ktedonobacterales bacterium]|nr:MAG: hypothetical protein OJF49_004260 [Ktedonobacterales bacterium]
MRCLADTRMIIPAAKAILIPATSPNPEWRNLVAGPYNR